MRITTIAVHIEPGAGATAEAAAAMAVAHAFEARVTALTFATEVMADGPPADSADTAMAAAAGAGVACDIRGRASYATSVSSELAAAGRTADLIIQPMAARPTQAQRLLLGAALFETGRPVLTLPPGMPAMPPRRVVLGWDGEAHAVRAAHNAMPFMALAEEVIVAFVTDDKAERPDDSGAAMAALLQRHGIKAQYRPVQRAGRGVLDALVAEAAGGMLAVGCVRHAPIRDLVFGSVTTDLFHGAAPMPVLATA
jgi:nucleotide-binding universal stress UspA family protein